MTPFFFASCSIAAPEAWSRSTIMSALTPWDSICWAMVFIFGADPPAFWMMQSRLYLVQSAFRAAGSAVTHRGEVVVSGRMIPTFAPLPSIVAPPAGADVAVSVVAGALVVSLLELLSLDLLLELEPQAANAVTAAIPSTASDILVLRMRSTSFPGRLASANVPGAQPVNVVGANISPGGRRRTQRNQVVISVVTHSA